MRIERLKQLYWQCVDQWGRLRLRFLLLHLAIRNRWVRSPVVDSEDKVTISLTTYGARLATVYLTLESVAACGALPGRIVLWLDAKQPLPRTLQRLMRRGLEVRYCENFGPHTKYYPYVEEHADFPGPLVTIDDDMIYPRGWLAALKLASASHPEHINCHRARVLLMDADGMRPYVEWPLCRTTHASQAHLATGVSGVIYPVSFQRLLRQAGRAFQTCCPRADDLWLHVIALRNSYQIHQIAAKAKDFPFVPGSQEQALFVSNQFGGENDVQIRKTYTASDLLRLRSALAEAGR